MDSTTQSKPPQTLDADAALETPAGSTAAADSFFLKPRNIRNWVKDLPIANIDETGQQLYKTLAAFNRTELPTLDRAESIELFREPVRHVNSNMALINTDMGFPMEPREKTAARLSCELSAEIAISYKIIIKELLAKGNTNFDQKLLIVAIHRALRYLGQALFQSCLSYSSPRPGVWREIHFLYAWSVQNHVHSIPVKETATQSWEQEYPSIEDLYKCHVLMSATSPQRLRQPQIRSIHAQLYEWSRLIKPVSPQDASPNADMFFVDLWSDNPPRKLTNAGEIKISGFSAFDLSNLIASLRIDFDNSSWESPTRIEVPGRRPSRSLLDLLLRGWNKSLERRFARRSLNQALDVVLGLDKLHDLLKQENHSRGQLSASPATSDQPQHDNQTANRETRNAPDTSEMFSLSTGDESVGGYRLRWKGAISEKVRVGDILGIRAHKPAAEYRLGMIRWLKYLQDHELYFGIEIISPGCHSATLIPPAATSSHQDIHFRCLLLNDKGVNKHPTELISDTGEFELNTVMTLVTDTDTRQIMLTDWLESSNSFIRYQFKYLEPTAESGNS